MPSDLSQTELNEYQSLFDELNGIYKKIQEKENETRKKFNIFTILRKRHDEVNLHSRFLAELLNPKGTHGSKIFQKLFIKKVINKHIHANNDWNRKEISPDLSFSCNYEVAHTGYGRIDVELKHSRKVIVIENKIYAEDQKNQLQRYYEACKNQYSQENIYVIYLNLDGSEISEYGKGNLDTQDYCQISYKDDILPWLESCLAYEDVTKHEHIKQTVLQYKTLVESLTGTGTKEMTEQLINLLYKNTDSNNTSNTSNFKLAQQLANSLDPFKIDVQRKVWSKLQSSLNSKGYNAIFCDKDLQPTNSRNMCNGYYKAKNANRGYGLQMQIGTYKDYSLHCFIQIQNCIYYGITIAKTDSNENIQRQKFEEDCQEISDAILNLIKNKNLAMRKLENKGKWWLGCSLYPKELVSFNPTNHVFEALINESLRDKWVEQTTEDIDTFISAVTDLGILER